MKVEFNCGKNLHTVCFDMLHAFAFVVLNREREHNRRLLSCVAYFVEREHTKENPEENRLGLGHPRRHFEFDPILSYCLKPILPEMIYQNRALSGAAFLCRVFF
jgi:hypothetical protein